MSYVTNTETADLLEKAADLIWDKGLAKNKYEAVDGSVCSLGALIRVAGVKDLFVGQSTLRQLGPQAARAVDRAANELAKHIGMERMSDVPFWNDRPERTQEEVRDAMLHTAKGLRNRARAA